LRYEQFERLKRDAFILQSLRMSIRTISIIFNQKLAEHAEPLITKYKNWKNWTSCPLN